MADSVGRIDRFQRRHRVAGFPIAVLYKFIDDQGNYLAAVLTYYAFIAIFPLLLIASSVLGFVLHDNPALQQQILNSALSQFPIIGDQLGHPGGLHGSSTAVVVGVLAALYGALGLGQAGQNTLNTAWSVPRNSRLNPFRGRLRSLVLLAMTGLAVLILALVNVFSNNAEVFDAKITAVFQVLIALGTVLGNAAVFTVLLWLGTAHRHRLREGAPGAITAALLWHGLQLAGAAYVKHVIVRANAMNKTFALVLGLVALIYVAAVLAVLCIEINVVKSNRLYPRALLTPFTDQVSLTEGDRRAYAAYAKGQRHKGFETILVSFGHPAEVKGHVTADRSHAPGGGSSTGHSKTEARAAHDGPEGKPRT